MFQCNKVLLLWLLLLQNLYSAQIQACSSRRHSFVAHVFRIIIKMWKLDSIYNDTVGLHLSNWVFDVFLCEWYERYKICDNGMRQVDTSWGLVAWLCDLVILWAGCVTVIIEFVHIYWWWCLPAQLHKRLCVHGVQSGFTPLHIAAHYGSLDVAKLLLDNGADIDFSARVCIACCMLMIIAPASGSNSQALVGVIIKVTYGALAAVEAATLQVWLTDHFVSWL